MTWIQKHLSKEDFKKIEDAISQVESTTTGEIVPVIVKKSSAVGHIPLTISLVTTLILLFIEITLTPFPLINLSIWIWPLLFTFTYFVSLWLNQWPWIQRPFISESDEMNQVYHRAHLEFFVNNVYDTKDKTGIMIFVSVMERKAVILADQGISKLLPPETWDGIIDELKKNLKQEKWQTGFVTAIEQCGILLKTHFPSNAADTNELKNNLIVKE